MCIVSWPARISARGDDPPSIRPRGGYRPDDLRACSTSSRPTIKGYTQSPIEGMSIAATFADPDAPGRDTQFYSMLGQRALYHEGWLVNTVHPPISGWGHFDHDEWELYDLRTDRPQTRNVAGERPDLVDKLKGLWFYYAGIYHGLPLDDRSPVEILGAERPQPSQPRNRYIYYPGTAGVPESVAAVLRGRSYTIAAGVELTTRGRKASSSHRAATPAATPSS